MGIALLAGLGAVLRYLTDRAVPPTHFPRGTLLVNLSGAFLLGLVVGGLSGDSVSLLGVGLLGGYTTMSTFAVETIALLERSRLGAALLNVALSAVLGLGAAWLGLQLAAALN